MKQGLLWLISSLLIASFSSISSAAVITLYDQDFESPSGYVNNFGSGYDDLSQQSVNSLYGNQPVGFTFAQTFTVETLLLTGNQVFGTGYSDASGQGGNYALGMLGTAQDDRLGLSFNVQNFDFFNFQVDISSLGIDHPEGRFNPSGTWDATTAPIFKFVLFDNPSATNTIGSGTVLDMVQLTGTASARDQLVWTTGQFALDTSNSTNGNVTLQIDLIQGPYAVFDNLLITASDQAGAGLDPVSAPSGLGLLLLFFCAGYYRKRQS